MTRTTRKNQRIHLPQIDQATFDAHKKQVLKGKKRKGQKISAKDIRLISKSINNESSFVNNSKDTDIWSLEQKLKSLQNQGSQNDQSLKQVNMIMKQVKRRNKTGDFSSHRNIRVIYKRETKNYERSRGLFKQYYDTTWGENYYYNENACYQNSCNKQQSIWKYHEFLNQKFNTIQHGDQLFEKLEAEDMSEYQEFLLTVDRYDSRIIRPRNRVSDFGMECLSRMNWERLMVLNLGNNMITAMGIKYISRLNLPCLMYLDVGTNLIGSEGLSHLSKAKMPSLEHLSLNMSKGLEHLTKGNFRYLNKLNIRKIDRGGNTILQNFELLKLLLMTDVNEDKTNTLQLQSWRYGDQQDYFIFEGNRNHKKYYLTIEIKGLGYYFYRSYQRTSSLSDIVQKFKKRDFKLYTY